MSHPNRKLKMGLFINTGEGMADGGKTPRWEHIKTMAQVAEDVGFDSIWIQDRFISPEDNGVWESYSVLAALAAVTTRAEIGNLVTWFGYRSPALLAKIADAIEEISGGRLILGLGARSFKDDEPRRFGYTFGWQEYYGRFAEALQIVHGLLRRGAIDFEGKYYRMRRAELRPRGPRPQGPPILIAAKGPKMMRLTAQYADEWNGMAYRGRVHPDVLADDQARLDEACADVGRDPATLPRSAMIAANATNDPATHPTDQPMASPLMGTTDEMVRSLQSFAAEGFSHLQVVATPQSPQGVEAFAPVLDALRQDSTQGQPAEGM